MVAATIGAAAGFMLAYQNSAGAQQTCRTRTRGACAVSLCVYPVWLTAEAATDMLGWLHAGRLMGFKPNDREADSTLAAKHG